jgi:hypothetical protein
MLDPRLYRTGLIVVVLGVIVFAFSLSGQPAPLSPNLAPDVYSAGAVSRTMQSLARAFPRRAPGSDADRRLAAYVADDLRAEHYTVQSTTFEAATAQGERTLQTVTATLQGASSRTIVLVAPRDLGGPPLAGVSATAVLLELGQVLAGQTHEDTIVLASTNASAGGAGTERLAQQLAGSGVDAVIVLGDLVRAHPTRPIILPWSDGQVLAPPLLRDTLAQAVSAQSPLRPTSPGLASQLAHGALPLAGTPQGPFGADGEPAVLLSLAGQRGPGRSEALDPPLAGSLGAAVLQSIDALDAAAPLPAPSFYLVLDGQLVPSWAVRLLVLVLIIPALGLAVDGAARARRRGARPGRALIWVLSRAAPFLLVLLTVRLAVQLSLISAPPDPLGPGAVPLLGGAGIALLVLIALELLGGLGWLATRPLPPPRQQSPADGRTPRGAPAGAADAAGAALALVLCLLALALWVIDPLAALLLVPAVHLWPWIAERDVALPRAARVLLLLGGLIAPALLVSYYVHAFGLTALAAIWGAVLIVGAGHVGLAVALLWSLALGGLVAALVLLLRRPPALPQPGRPVTVRGPLSYAGPGSLGGTESALRR